MCLVFNQELVHFNDSLLLFQDCFNSIGLIISCLSLSRMSALAAIQSFSQSDSLKVHFFAVIFIQSAGADVCKQLIKGVSTSTEGANSGSGNRVCSCIRIFNLHQDLR